MKKMFKAAASLAVGCALLSTSAFAALDGSVSFSENTISADITLDSAESTVLVLKGAKTAMPASVLDSDIAYINQETVSDGAVAYSMPVDGTTAYTVFAGGSNETSATLLGVVNFAISATATEVDENATITLTTNAGEGVAVVWESDNTGAATVDGGVVTGVKEGSANITAKVMNGEDVLASATQAITVKAVAPVGDYFDITGVDGETKKATVQTVNLNIVKAAWWDGYSANSKKVKIDLDETVYPRTDAEGNAITYMLSVVREDGSAATQADIYYSTEGDSFVGIVSSADATAGYKYKVDIVESVPADRTISLFGKVVTTGIQFRLLAADSLRLGSIVAGTYTEENYIKTSLIAAMKADTNNDGVINVSDVLDIGAAAAGTDKVEIIK